MPSPLASDTKTRLSRDAPTCSCLTLWTPTVGLYGGRINTRFSDDPSTVDMGRLIRAERESERLVFIGTCSVTTTLVSAFTKSDNRAKVKFSFDLLEPHIGSLLLAFLCLT